MRFALLLLNFLRQFGRRRSDRSHLKSLKQCVKQRKHNQARSNSVLKSCYFLTSLRQKKSFQRVDCLLSSSCPLFRPKPKKKNLEWYPLGVLVTELKLYNRCLEKFLKVFVVGFKCWVGEVEIVVFSFFYTLVAASIYTAWGAITTITDFCDYLSFFTEGSLFNFIVYFVPTHFLSFSQFYCDKLLVDFLTKLGREVLNCLWNLKDFCMQNIRRGKNFPVLPSVEPYNWPWWRGLVSLVDPLQNIWRNTCCCHLVVFYSCTFVQLEIFWHTLLGLGGNRGTRFNVLTVLSRNPTLNLSSHPNLRWFATICSTTILKCLDRQYNPRNDTDCNYRKTFSK